MCLILDFLWQDLCTCTVQENESEGYFRSQITDGIGSQESIQVNKIYYFEP